jgi:Prophage protein (DUF1660)
VKSQSQRQVAVSDIQPSKLEAIAGKLACELGQHDWEFDPEDIRFRICTRCETVEGKVWSVDELRKEKKLDE